MRAQQGIGDRDLLGPWRLTSHYLLEPDGSTGPGPCGERAEGLLIYEAHGYMSAALMAGDGDGEGDGDGAGPGAAVPYLGYSGRWRVAGDRLVHRVAVGSHARVVGTEQIREARLEGDRLTLRESLGAGRYLVLEWRRAEPAAAAMAGEERTMQTNGFETTGGGS